MGILDMSNPLNAIGVGILGNQGNVGRGLLTGVGLYNNQLAANQQRAIREQQIAAAERQAWLQKQQLRAMGTPAAATVPTLNNGQVFPGIGTAFAPNGTPGQTGWAQYGQQNTTPGTGMFSQNPKEIANAEMRMAAASGNPGAVQALQAAREEQRQNAIMNPLNVQHKRALINQANQTGQQETFTYGNAAIPDGNGGTVTVAAKKGNRGTLLVQNPGGGWTQAPYKTQFYSLQGQGSVADLGLSGSDKSKIVQAEARNNVASERLASQIAMIEKHPEVVGGIARGREFVGGITDQVGAQLGSPSIRETASKISPDILTTYSTNAQFIEAQLLPTISGDNSGRYTDTERDIARTALKMLEGATGPAQTVTALKAANAMLSGDTDMAQKLLGMKKSEGGWIEYTENGQKKRLNRETGEVQVWEKE
jgi:hypothetical protein